MQQIKHRISPAPGILIPCRSIHGHTPGHSQRRRIIPDLGHSPMTHIFHAVQAAFFPWHDENIHQRPYITHQKDVRRIKHLHSVHHENIAVKFRLQRSGSPAPYSGLAFGQFGTAPSALSGRKEIAAHFHLDSFRSMNPESHRTIFVDLRRHLPFYSENSLLPHHRDRDHQNRQKREKDLSDISNKSGHIASYMNYPAI